MKEPTESLISTFSVLTQKPICKGEKYFQAPKLAKVSSEKCRVGCDNQKARFIDKDDVINIIDQAPELVQKVSLLTSLKEGCPSASPTPPREGAYEPGSSRVLQGRVSEGVDTSIN
jgi:hypothetical protein